MNCCDDYGKCTRGHGCPAGPGEAGEQLRECINSGQVSAAQVVAHAEAGELPFLPSPARMVRPTNGYPNVVVYAYHANQMRAYATAAIAAERTEVARLREALFGLSGALTRMDRARGLLTDNNPRRECNWGMLDTSDLRTALAAPGEKHE